MQLRRKHCFSTGGGKLASFLFSFNSVRLCLEAFNPNPGILKYVRKRRNILSLTCPKAGRRISEMNLVPGYGVGLGYLSWEYRKCSPK